jgi:hypothetical protein
MVSWGKRGSLPVAGGANIVAVNQPPVAAIASEDMKIADFTGFLRAFLELRHRDANPAAFAAPAAPENICRSDRADIG